jgi:hypothetical protein
MIQHSAERNRTAEMVRRQLWLFLCVAMQHYSLQKLHLGLVALCDGTQQQPRLLVDEGLLCVQFCTTNCGTANCVTLVSHSLGSDPKFTWLSAVLP